MTKYIGTKVVDAEPQIKDGNEGYKVVYEDGYTSWSPKDVFEKAYHEVTGVSFGNALEAVKRGKGMRLPSWKEDVVVRVKHPVSCDRKEDAFILGLMTAPFLYVQSRYGLVPWKETMIELFSEQWEIVD